MKTIKKILCTVIAASTFVATVPMMSTSAASKVSSPEITVKNVNKGVKITWTKATKATKYTVYRKLTSAESYSKLKTISKSSSGSFVDKTAKDGKTYKYKVVASNSLKKASSNVVKAMRLSTPDIYAYTEPDCICVDVSNTIKGAKKIEVYRAKISNGKEGSYKKVGTFKANDKDAIYEDVDTVNAIYKYKVRAVNGSYKSAFSSVASVDYIQAPWSYSQATSDNTAIDINWMAVSGVEGFRICRSVDGKDAVVVADIKLTDCEKSTNPPTSAEYYIYKDTDVTTGHTYTYYVQAYSGYRVSAVEEAFLPVTL